MFSFHAGFYAPGLCETRARSVAAFIGTFRRAADDIRPWSQLVEFTECIRLDRYQSQTSAVWPLSLCSDCVCLTSLSHSYRQHIDCCKFHPTVHQERHELSPAPRCPPVSSGVLRCPPRGPLPDVVPTRTGRQARALGAGTRRRKDHRLHLPARDRVGEDVAPPSDRRGRRGGGHRPPRPRPLRPRQVLRGAGRVRRAGGARGGAARRRRARAVSEPHAAQVRAAGGADYVPPGAATSHSLDSLAVFVCPRSLLCDTTRIHSLTDAAEPPASAACPCPCLPLPHRRRPVACAPRTRSASHEHSGHHQVRDSAPLPLQCAHHNSWGGGAGAASSPGR